jgi:hypothetical protein
MIQKMIRPRGRNANRWQIVRALELKEPADEHRLVTSDDVTVWDSHSRTQKLRADPLCSRFPADEGNIPNVTQLMLGLLT